MEKIDLINVLMTDILDNILLIEEKALTSGREKRPTINETHIIDRIGRRGEIRMSDISAETGITTASMTVAADKLEAKGLITRARDGTDRRVVKLSLTRKGQAVYRLHSRFHKNMINDFMSDLSGEQESALLSALEKLRVYLVNFNA